MLEVSVLRPSFQVYSQCLNPKIHIYNIKVVQGDIGIMEKKMETTNQSLGCEV